MEQNNPLLEKVEQNVVENNPPEYSKLYGKAAFVSSYRSEKVQSVEPFSPLNSNACLVSVN